MAAAGMGGPDSIQFMNVIRAFQKYGYSTSKIMGVFAEIIDVEDAREEIKEEKRLLEEQRKVHGGPSDLGFDFDFEKFTQTLAALMTLAQYGVDCDKIISISRP